MVLNSGSPAVWSNCFRICEYGSELTSYTSTKSSFANYSNRDSCRNLIQPAPWGDASKSAWSALTAVASEGAARGAGRTTVGDDVLLDILDADGAGAPTVGAAR